MASIIGTPLRDLKFRQVKLRVMDRESKTFPIKWMVLNRAVDFAIKDRESLQMALDGISTRYQIRRVFSTGSAYLNPSNLGAQVTDRERLNIPLETWVTFESDYNLEFSQRLAKYVYNELYDRGYEERMHVIAIGGRSIHIWVKFDYEKWVGDSLKHHLDKLNYRFDLQRRVWLEKVSRQRFFDRVLPPDSERYWDLGTMLDVRRVLPVVGTWNFYASKYITEIDPKLLFDETSGEILRRTTLEPYRKLYYVKK